MITTHNHGFAETDPQNEDCSLGVPSSSGELGFDMARQGCSYVIVSSSAEGRNRMRMDSLGLIPGDVVHVLFSNYSGLVVAIKGSRLALGRSVAACLTVKELDNGDWLTDARA